MNSDQDLDAWLSALADHLLQKRHGILEAWRHAVEQDPALASSSTLARDEFYDHIPAVLDAFDQMLRARDLAEKADAAEEQKEKSAEHGLHRWHHGYNQRDVMREWTHLHLCLVNELETYSVLNSHNGIDRSLSIARRALAELSSNGVNESAACFAELQQVEARSRIEDLQQALATLSELERKRLEVWRRAVHDVRGKFGVIKTISDQLSDEDTDRTSKDDFLTMLGKSVASLHELLNNLLVLSRLEAGEERRHVETIDAAVVLRELCESIRALALERGLYLRVEGLDSLPIQGDISNIQRIAQNLILNAIRYTVKGGVTIGWQSLDTDGLRRWAFSVKDTGPGFQSGSAAPLAQTIEASTAEAKAVDEVATSETTPAKSETIVSAMPTCLPRQQSAGEGVGLTIVKRLCELLDATLELNTIPGQGSTFRVILPQVYDAH
jgi:signal transduction histidine kinase